MLTLDNVCFSYPNSRSSVLNNVSLSIEEGTFVAVLGANGCGKSTLSKLLNAILVPTSGSVLVDGLSTSSASNVYAIRSKVGLVFQNPDTQIICDTVEDDIAFGLENMGLSVSEMRQRLEACLAMTGLEALRLVNPNKLSGGQKQLVAIAGVLAMRPKYIILDEATSMLDPQGRKLVLDFAHKLNKEQGLAIILITHKLEECVDVDKVVLLEKGSVSFEGTVKELFESSLVPSDSLALPVVTQLSERLIADGVNLPHGILTVEEFCRNWELATKPAPTHTSKPASTQPPKPAPKPAGGADA